MASARPDTVLAIGEPYTIPAKTPLDELERHREAVQQAVMSLMQKSENILKSSEETPA